MAIITVDDEIKAVPMIVELITRERVPALARAHPLARGLRCFLEIDQVRTLDDLRAIYEVENFARTIERHLIGKGNDAHLAKHLRKLSGCRALSFEAEVVQLLLEPFVSSLEWRRYEEGGADVLTSDPEIQVECTLVAGYSLLTMLTRVTEARKQRQRREGKGAFLLCVGSDEPQEHHIFADVEKDTELRMALDAWMKRHPEVSAIYFAAPRIVQGDEAVRDWNASLLSVGNGTGFCVRNRGAFEPLPAGFEDNWRGTRNGS